MSRRLFSIAAIFFALTARGHVFVPTPSELTSQPATLESWCKEVRTSAAILKWKIDPCSTISWKVGGHSVKGRPLVYAEFGDAKAQNTTLIFSTVHGDEITPLYLALQLSIWLKNREGELSKTKVVVAPLVNPDGFFSHPRTRVNARGVDVNRNFATQDWKNKAWLTWQKKYRSDPRRFPGKEARSEPETRFQEELIRLVRPQKILAVHSPLNFLDYDGPSTLTLSQFPKDYALQCDRLKKRLKAISAGFFPGSLGNYAGRELGIPTLTLELPSTDPAKAENYWKKFSDGIQTMIHFNFGQVASNSSKANPGG